MTGLDRIRESAHPRLAIIIVVGVVIMAVAAILALMGSVTELQSTRYSLPIAIVGYLLFMFGGSGYVSMWVFERRPES